MSAKKKLIEVALPLEAINRESAREKSIRHGHPSTLHLWWARRPLAACRAVLFAQLVDDPSSRPEEFPTEEAQEQERRRLFRILEELVKWENSNNEQVLDAARAEIRKSTGGNPPPVLDPFCGGGSIPLEAQRLGLEAHASDLNPVAVLITKALIEIPPQFAGHPPVHPSQNQDLVQREWRGAQGLAEDVRFYGQWMRDEAERRIGHFYPKVELPTEYGGDEATVIAWLWARTVTCPNPACGARMPLVRSFALSTKKGQKAWVVPIVDRVRKAARFQVRMGEGMPMDGTIKRQGARCLVCDTPVPFDHVRSEGRAGHMDAKLMAIVAEGPDGRVYLPPNEMQEAIAAQAQPVWEPDTNLPEVALGFRVQGYGITKHSDLFTSRQLVALTTFSDLVGEARERVRRGAVACGLPDDNAPLDQGGIGAHAYADAVATYLACCVSRCADYWSANATWEPGGGFIGHTFTRGALPMVWDYAEAHPLGGASGNWLGATHWVARVIDLLCPVRKGVAWQADATAFEPTVAHPVICTDPPYYDNVPYADLSDVFYVWLRRSLGSIHPALFRTVLVPKAQELVAEPFRHNNLEQAQRFFEEGLAKAFAHMRGMMHPDYPLTIFYALVVAWPEIARRAASRDSAAVQTEFFA